MRQNISPPIDVVNKHSFFTFALAQNKLADMRYGERLKIARGLMTQAELSEISGVSQALISQLEHSLTADGSKHTNRLARALKISADWLADEIGEMIPLVYQTSDPKIIAAARVMEPLSEYGKNAAVKNVTEIAELLAHARDGGNGTDG